MPADREILRISEKEYRALPCISSSELRTFATHGPLVYHAIYIARTLTRPDTDAMRLGRAFHLAVSDWSAWKNGHEIIPDTIEDDETLASVRARLSAKSRASLDPGTPLSMRFPAHRQYLAMRREACIARGKQWIAADEAERIEAQVAAVLANPAARRLVEHGEAEVCMTHTDEYTGLPLKARFDRLDTERRIVIDFKTTRETTPEGFRRDLINRGYHYQAAHYLHVSGADEFYFVTITAEQPYEAMVYTLSRDLLAEAARSNADTLRKIMQCREFDSWHTPYWGDVVVLSQTSVLRRC